MEILKLSLLFLLGLGILYYGAEGLVRGSSSIARRLGVRPVMVGLTIIAFGTSAPEFFVSVLSAMNGVTDIAIGNVVGSNIANVGLVMGTSALLYPFAIKKTSISREYYISIAATIVFIILGLNGTIGRTDGLILVAGIILFTYSCVKTELKNKNSGEKAVESENALKLYAYPTAIVMTVAGLVMLVGGAQLMTDSAVKIARIAGVSELAIGMTVVALGTSLPEMAASIVGVARGEAELSVGNILGSNIFNLLMVIGGASIAAPLTIDRSVMMFQIPAMAAFTLVIAPSLLIKQKTGRLMGIALIAGYVAFIAASFLQ